MTVVDACQICTWSAERHPSDVPPRCPDCGAGVERGSDPSEDDGSWKSGEA